MDRSSKSMVAAGILALVSIAAQADGDADRGRKLAYTCMGCHGVEHYKNAYPSYSVPKLGGQNKPYIVSALEEYQSGSRMHPTMRGFASSLSDQDRADLAAFFHSRVPAAASAEAVGTPPEKAQLCVACHGTTGRGTTPEYPNIGGQHPDYIEQALNDYRLGKRKNPIMAPFAQQLTKEDIELLAEYFSEQKGLETPELD
jgi:cytochrome c553